MRRSEHMSIVRDGKCLMHIWSHYVCLESYDICAYLDMLGAALTMIWTQSRALESAGPLSLTSHKCSDKIGDIAPWYITSTVLGLVVESEPSTYLAFHFKSQIEVA